MKIAIISNSTSTSGGNTYFLARNESSGERFLGLQSGKGAAGDFGDLRQRQGDINYYSLNTENAAALRQLFSWLNPQPTEPANLSGMRPSFGFGDRLGLATPGHIHALRAAVGQRKASTGNPPQSSSQNEETIAPIFAQQSVRENARTGRTPQQVVDDAMWGVFQEGWRSPWGADADHLKNVSDLPAFIQAGYSFFTVDPGVHVDIQADDASEEILDAKIAVLDWSEIIWQSGPAAPMAPADLEHGFLAFCESSGQHLCEQDDLPALRLAAKRAAAKYGPILLHIAGMYKALIEMKPAGFDFEVSVDETDSPTSVFEHYYIASELKRMGVRLTSLAPRLPGRFEKGVDFIGALSALEDELARHCAVMRAIGGYKISLHSGSDKFSLYPLFARQAGKAVHVKTAGTSYLEALRVAASLDTGIFRQALALARSRYPQERLSYHVSADEKRLPAPETLADAELPGLLDDFHVRQALHVTYGSALAQFGNALKTMLLTHPIAYERVLLSHFLRHLEPLLNE
jgi:hypothetical protein